MSAKEREVQLTHLESSRPPCLKENTNSRCFLFGREAAVRQNYATQSNPFFSTRAAVPSRAMQQPCSATSGLKIMVCLLGHCWQIVICRPGGHFLGREDLSAKLQTAFGQIVLSIPSNMDLPLLLKPLWFKGIMKNRVIPVPFLALALMSVGQGPSLKLSAAL